MKKRIRLRPAASNVNLGGGSAPVALFHYNTLALVRNWLKLLFREFFRNRCDLRASVLTFTTVLSLVPVLAVFFTFFDLFGGGEWLAERIKPFLIENLSIGVGDRAIEILDQLLVKAPTGTLGALGTLFLALAGLSLLSALEDTFNYIWKVTQGRSLFVRFRNYWVAVTVVPLAILVSLFATSSVQWSATLQTLLWPWAYGLLTSVVFPVALDWLGLFLLFRLVPNVSIGFFPAALGALIGSVLWEAAKRIYFLYTSILVSNNVLYGTFIALPLFFIWLNISFMILLLAMEAAYVTQNYRELQRFPMDQAKYFSMEGVALNLLVDIAHRQCLDADPIRVNTAAARFEVRAPEFKNLLKRLVGAHIIHKPSGDDDYLRLAHDPENISLVRVMDALGGVPESGLPEEARERIRQIQQIQRKEISQLNLKDIAVPSGEECRA
ncbi:MAG: YihY/virulence factor BrkB family protein [Candidatus Zixiibacteriota bacterium]|nr:MAG: YihY/virulence factor BrkB family protein [candidate division Zixibacteria bacterium]